MSVKADVKIIMLKENYEELDNKIRTQGFEDYELCLWNNKREERNNKGFVLLSWNYIKWDEPTDEVVEMILNYLRMLRKNNVPCKYIAIYEEGFDEEITSYGDNPEDLGFIIGSIYISREIQVSDGFYSEEE